MFVLCPHCQFLVALEPASGQPPARCPRCQERLQTVLETAPLGELHAAIEAPTADIVETLHVAVETVAATVEATPVAVDTPTVPAEPVEAAEGSAALLEAQDVRSAVGDLATTAVADVVAHVGSDNASADAVPADASASPTPTPTPRSMSSPLPSATTRRRLAIASVPLLAIVLLLQSLLSDRDRLASDARWRPLMTVVCDVLPCTLPPWREPAAFTLLDRDVRPDPHRPGVLHVSAGFRNDARWRQPWPALLLTLSDADGRIAGARSFRPDEYLATPATKNGLASGQSAKVSFDVIEPTRDVVAFTFDFR